MFSQNELFGFFGYLFLGALIVGCLGGLSAASFAGLILFCIVGIICTWAGGSGSE